MASRDLTTFFFRSRSLFHRPKASGVSSVSDGGDLLGASGDASVDMSSLALSGASPVYVETVNELQSDLGSITTRCAYGRRGLGFWEAVQFSIPTSTAA